MIQLKKLLIIASTMSMFLTVNVSAWEIDFDTYLVNGVETDFRTATNPSERGQIVDDEYTYDIAAGTGLGANLGATFTGYKRSGSSAQLAVFDTDNYTGGDSDLAAPFSGPTNNYRPGNVLVIHERNSECNNSTCLDPDDHGRGGMMKVDYNMDVTLSSIDFFDIEHNETGTSFRVELFDALGAIIKNTLTNANYWLIPNTGGDNTWDRVSFNVGNVRQMKVFLGGSGAIDNIQGSVTRIANVPEPSTIALFGLVFGLVGTRKLFKK